MFRFLLILARDDICFLLLTNDIVHLLLIFIVRFLLMLENNITRFLLMLVKRILLLLLLNNITCLLLYERIYLFLHEIPILRKCDDISKDWVRLLTIICLCPILCMFKFTSMYVVFVMYNYRIISFLFTFKFIEFTI